jgi:site-specific DNA recombinase
MSQDRSGEELGVERHEKDCRKLAKKLNLKVEHVYSDNDQSATTGKPRPGFEAMLAAKPKAIVAWHQDRLLRLTKDLERVIDVGIPVYFVASAENGLDLSSPAGRAVARTVAAWSQYEGEQKRLRQLSKNRQLAEHGHWQFSLRPFGYERVGGKIVQVPAEAAVILEGYERVLKGASYREVASDWNTRGIKPLIGEQWVGSRVQRLLENSHYGGIPSYKGEEVDLDEGKQIQWTPILTARQWKDFRELKLNRKRKRSWAVTPKHLMSGMLACGVCSGQMFSHAQDVTTRTNTRNAKGNPVRVPVLREDGTRVKRTTYVCVDKHCASIRGEYVDALVRTVVLKKLADERVVKAIRPSDDALPVQDEIADLQRRRDDVTELVGEGLMDKMKAREKLADLSERLGRAQGKLAAIRAESPLSDIRLAESVPERWDALPVLEKRRIIADLGLRLTINPAGKGERGMDSDTGEKYTQRAWALMRIDWEMPED